MDEEQQSAGGVGPGDPGVVALLGVGHVQVSAFHDLLAEEGVLRGLIGPREVPRLWERHLLNSAAVAAFLPDTGTVIDVGSGAGLPGIVLAAMRPDLHVVLLEPMERRVVWLEHVVAELGLGSCEVRRGRAEDVADGVPVDAVTARAVAPLDRLVRWTMPLLREGGILLAMKGDRAASELDEAVPALTETGALSAEVLDATTVDGVEPTTVVRVVAGPRPPERVTKPGATPRRRRPR